MAVMIRDECQEHCGHRKKINGKDVCTYLPLLLDGLEIDGKIIHEEYPEVKTIKMCPIAAGEHLHRQLSGLTHEKGHKFCWPFDRIG